jgi:hypothetical protein
LHFVTVALKPPRKKQTMGYLNPGDFGGGYTPDIDCVCGHGETVGVEGFDVHFIPWC